LTKHRDLFTEQIADAPGDRVEDVGKWVAPRNRALDRG
jgi:hypothetical protein